MILNAARTSWLATYQPRRESSPIQKPKAQLVDGVRPDPHGSFEEKCAWMRARQEEKRKNQHK